MKKQSLFLLAILSSLTLFVVSCGDESPLNPDETNQRGTISGTIVDQFEKPLSGVSITTNKEGFNSNSILDGSYSIPDIESDLYTLTFSKVGFFDTTMDTTITIAKMAQVININMVMHKKTGTITGSVIDSAGAALTNVTVTLSPTLNGVGSEKSINTGTDAAFSIEKVDLGIYEVQCTHPSYTAVNTPLCTLSSDNYTDSILITMRYNGGGAIITGHVFTTEKMPAKGATIKANGTASGEGTVGTDGSFSITGLETGEYSIEVVSLEYSDTLLAQKIQTKLDSTTLVDTIYVRKELNIKTGTVTGVLKSGEGSVPTLTSWSVSLTNQDTTISVTGEASTGFANYTLSPIPEGSWKVIATDLKHSADSSNTVTVVDGQTHTLDTIILVDNNTKFIQRSVLGQFQVHRDTVDTVIVEVKGMGIPQWIPVGCSYNKTFGTFSGVVNVPESGQAWHIRTKAFVKTTTGKLIKIGQSKDIEFTKSSGDVEVTDFTDPTNAIPTVEILSPNDALIDTDVQLICNEHDTFEGVVERKEWTVTVDETIEGTRSGDTVTYRFMKEKTYTIELTITDDNSNVVSTSKTIRIDNPDAIIYGLTSDTITVNDTLTFSIMVNDPNGVNKILWDFGEGDITRPQFDSTLNSTSSTVKHIWPSKVHVPLNDTQSYIVRVMAFDTFDKITLDSCIVTVTNQRPQIVINSRTIDANSGEDIITKFTATDDNKVLKYSFSHGGITYKTDSGFISYKAPDIIDGDYPVTITIEDDDNNVNDTTIINGISVWKKNTLIGYKAMLMPLTDTNFISAEVFRTGISSEIQVHLLNSHGEVEKSTIDKCLDYKLDRPNCAVSSDNEKFAISADCLPAGGSSSTIEYFGMVRVYNRDSDFLFAIKTPKESKPDSEQYNIANVCFCDDNSLISIGSYRPSNANYNNHQYIQKTSLDGDDIWFKLEKTDESNQFIIDNKDGTLSIISHLANLKIIDYDGNIISSNKIDIENSNEIALVKRLQDGHLLIRLKNGEIFKININGKQIWKYHRRVGYSSDYMTSVIQKSNSNITVLYQEEKKHFIETVTNNGDLVHSPNEVFDSTSKVLNIVPIANHSLIIHGYHGYGFIHEKISLGMLLIKSDNEGKTSPLR